MGLFSFIKRSREKTNLIKKMIKVLDSTNNDSEKETVLKDFFEFISEDKILGAVLKEHKVSYDEFNYYIKLMCMNGFGWHKGRYIPVDVFSFAKEMEYFLTAIEKEEKIELIYSNLIRDNY